MWFYIENNNDNQIVRNNVLIGYKGNIPKVLNVREGVNVVLGEKAARDLANHKFGNDIFYNAFNQNSVLEEIYLPSSVYIVGAKAFEHAHALRFISFPESLEEICLSAFLGCCSLKKITLPKSIKLLETWCFSLIDNLVITYKGSKEDFNKIEKGEEWCNKGTKVICEDGEIFINNL